MYIFLLFIDCNCNNLWNKFKKNIINIDELSENELIFFSLYSISNETNILENLEKILLKQDIYLPVFYFRKSIEEQALMLKDGEKKQKILESLKDNYIKYSSYKPITKNFKKDMVLKYFRFSYVFKYKTYRLSYICIKELFFFHSLEDYELKQIYHIYNMDLRDRIINNILNNKLISAEKTAIFLNDPLWIKIFYRIKYISECKKKPKVFLNILEIYIYILYLYDNNDFFAIGDVIIHHKKMLSSAFLFKDVKNKIMIILDKIFPELLVSNYPNIKLLLTEDYIHHYEYAANYFFFIKAIYFFFQKNYYESLIFFSKALAKHKNINEKAKYTFWMANTLFIMKKYKNAFELYEKTVNLNVFYYSHMSLLMINKKSDFISLNDITINTNSNNFDWFFVALRIIAEGNDFFYYFRIYNNIDEFMINKFSLEMINNLKKISELENKSFIVLICDMFMKKSGLIISEGFPYIKEMEKFEISLKKKMLLLAFLKEESVFREDDLESNKGALGIMQIMPHVAVEICNKKKIQFCKKKLKKDKSYNIQISVFCLEELIKLNKNYIFLIIPSYNIGITKVLTWQKNLNLDLKNSIIDNFLFVELIPNNITKKYTKDVITNFFIFLSIHSNNNSFSFQDIIFLEENYS